MKDPIGKIHLLLVLLIGVLALSSLTISAQDSGIYNIIDYGGIGDGKTLNTKAIQKAIDQCHKNGGGTIAFPAGTYL